MDSFFVILAAVVAAALVATAILLVSRQADRSAAGPDGADARLQQLEKELAAVREARAEADRRLAAEEQKAARIPALERDLEEARVSLDTMRDAKAAGDRELARASANSAQDARTVAENRARLTELEANLRDAATRSETLRSEKGDLEAALADIRARLHEKTETAEGQRKDFAETQAHLTITRKELAVAREENSRLQEQLSQEMKQAADKLHLLKDAKEQMSQQFRVLAEEVMNNHGETFAKQNKEQISGLLNPLKDRLVEFQQGLQNAQTDSAKERANLGAQIRTLTETSVSMTRETHNLTQALKGKVQTQGAWGEMILGTILERSGLRNGEEYVTQESHATDDGGRLRPDVLINLPNGERLVIDSKVSLTAFEAYVNTEDDAARAANLSRHLTSIRNHIKSLSAKEYHQTTGNVEFPRFSRQLEARL